jgi:hypothetical protein
MLKSELFSNLEETLKKAQELMTKVIEQNATWTGSGAFEDDIVTAGNLIKAAQTQFFEVGMAAYQSNGVDEMKSVNNRLNQAYNLLSLMQQDTKKIQSSLERGKSQSKAIIDLEIHLKKFIKHCDETQSWLLEAGKLER